MKYLKIGTEKCCEISRVLSVQQFSTKSMLAKNWNIFCVAIARFYTQTAAKLIEEKRAKPLQVKLHPTEKIFCSKYLLTGIENFR